MQSHLRVILLVIYIFCVQGFASANLVNNSSGRQFRCDYEYTRSLGWLKVHEMPTTWRDARLRCHLEGAVLASPLTTELREAMLTAAKKKGLNCGVFTGIHATFSKGDFNSVEGIPLHKIPHTWSPDEPDNFKNEEDALILLPDGKMADVRSKDAFPYLCFKKKADLVVTSCGTTDPEYNLDARTGHCYKFHKVPRVWSRAFFACKAEGGYLAIINSEVEATVLRELFAKNPGGAMIGTFWKDVAFVGFHDWTEHGEWRTIEGQTLKEAGYDKFSPGEPNNATTGEYCGAIYRNALFDDLWCENPYAFICEDPGSLACNDD